MLRLDGADVPSGTPADPDATIRYVRELLELSPFLAPNDDAPNGFWDSLVRSLDVANRRVYLIIDGVDAILTLNVGLRCMVQPYPSPSADPSNRLRLITTAKFPVASIVRLAEEIGATQSDGFRGSSCDLV